MKVLILRSFRIRGRYVMVNGRIAVMISEIFDPLDYELLNGIYTKASSLGYDTICLTGIRDVRFSTNNKIVSDKMDNVYRNSHCSR